MALFDYLLLKILVGDIDHCLGFRFVGFNL